MGILITSADFTGENVVATDVYTEERLNSFIAAYEAKLLYELLGIELCDLFVADLVNKVPQTAKYLTIYNAFVKEINDKMYNSDGMKLMLVKLGLFPFC